MPCYNPLEGYRPKRTSPDQPRTIVFNLRDGWADQPVKVPCGQCIGCKLERSRQWALRCQAEAQLYEDNCFITLTFDDEHLPSDYSINVRDFQLFMKSLKSYVRYHFDRERAKGIRFFHCGEYGEKNGRPHYHAILFNWDFPDKVLFSSRQGTRLYTSAILSKLWPYGFSTIGSVTFESAAYVARYCLKKLTGPDSDRKYIRVHPITGRVCKVRPEYATMSRRPGIGKKWYDEFKSDVYPHDFVVRDGVRMRPPKFFDALYEGDDPRGFLKVKQRRLVDQKAQHEEDMQYRTSRMLVRKTVKEAQVKQLKRGLDDDS